MIKCFKEYYSEEKKLSDSIKFKKVMKEFADGTLHDSHGGIVTDRI